MDNKFVQVSQIKIRGIKQIESMKFHDIEGGFGEGKKAMLVKEIAEIHGRELREVNERINLNKKRFKDYIDIIDLLGIDLTDTEIKEFGFTQQSINSYRGLKAKGQMTGIYLLSERGYAKLLKILEDDVAWEQYEKLVDGYFNIRKELENIQPVLNKSKEIEARLINAKVRQANLLLKIANTVDIESYKKILQSKATEILNDGQTLIPLPKSERKTYSATEVGSMLGITANKVGKLANSNNLKTGEYGELVWDKSKYSAKEVQSFRYYEEVIPVLKGLI